MTDRLLRLISVVVMLATLAGCTSETADDVERIRILGSACDGCNDATQIFRDGTVFIGQDLHASEFTNAGLVGAAFDTFPLALFERVASGPPQILAPTEVVVVTVIFRDGRSQDASVPLTGTSEESGIGPLQNWIDRTVGLDRMSATPLTAAIERETLEAVTLTRTPCYGPCPTYTARFDSHGTATLRDFGPECHLTAKATLPFSRVLAALRASEAAALSAYYPPRAIDTPGAELAFSGDHMQFVSKGPDVTSWGTPFRTTVARLDQIVRDTRWTPHADIDACATAGPPQPTRWQISHRQMRMNSYAPQIPLRFLLRSEFGSYGVAVP